MREMTEKDPVFRQQKEKLIESSGWGERRWNNLLNAIDAARKTTLQRFLYSLNVPLLGHDLSKKLSKVFVGDVKRFLSFAENPDAELLMREDGIGEEKAHNIMTWCRGVRDDA